MNKDDRKIHKVADQIKSDLAQGADVQVPTGDEPSPGERPNPFDARKALFAKANAKADAVSQPFNEGQPAQPAPTSTPAPAPKPDQPTVADLERARLEAAGKTAPDPAQPAPAPVANADDYVMVDTANGKLSVRQADVDRAGGVEMYVAQRAIDESRALLQAERVRLERDRAVLEQERRQAAEQGRAPTASGRDAAAQAGHGQVTADQLADLVYSGDAADMRTAMQTLLDQISSARDTPPREVQPTPKAVEPQPAPSMQDAVNQAINEMTSRDYPDVCGDPVARAASYQKFLQMASDTRNKDRRVLDIARDACEWGRMQFMHPRAAVVESKRGLPPSSTASSAVLQTEPTEPESRKDTVEMLAKYRQFGKRAQQ